MRRWGRPSSRGRWHMARGGSRKPPLVGIAVGHRRGAVFCGRRSTQRGQISANEWLATRSSRADTAGPTSRRRPVSRRRCLNRSTHARLTALLHRDVLRRQARASIPQHPRPQIYRIGRHGTSGRRGTMVGVLRTRRKRSSAAGSPVPCCSRYAAPDVDPLRQAVHAKGRQAEERHPAVLPTAGPREAGGLDRRATGGICRSRARRLR
jgi:hypothetical protein